MLFRISLLALCSLLALPALADPAPASQSTAPSPAAPASAPTSADASPAATATAPAPPPLVVGEPTLPGVNTTTESPGAPIEFGTSTPVPIMGTDLAIQAPAPEYIQPTLETLLRTLVRFNALDLRDDHLVDEYAMATDCDIYQYYYKDDFKWNEIRKKLRTSGDINMNTYPVHYFFVTDVVLDRYDFDRKMYRFTDGTAIQGINVFTLYKLTPGICGSASPQYVPTTYQGIADAPFTLVGLPVSASDAQSLLRQMNADKNTEHKIYAKFDLTVTYVEKLNRKVPTANERDTRNKYFQGTDPDNSRRPFHMDVHIDSVGFYEDASLTKVVYSLKP